MVDLRWLLKWRLLYRESAMLCLRFQPSDVSGSEAKAGGPDGSPDGRAPGRRSNYTASGTWQPYDDSARFLSYFSGHHRVRMSDEPDGTHRFSDVLVRPPGKVSSTSRQVRENFIATGFGITPLQPESQIDWGQNLGIGSACHLLAGRPHKIGMHVLGLPEELQSLWHHCPILLAFQGDRANPLSDLLLVIVPANTCRTHDEFIVKSGDAVLNVHLDATGEYVRWSVAHTSSNDHANTAAGVESAAFGPTPQTSGLLRRTAARYEVLTHSLAGTANF